MGRVVSKRYILYMVPPPKCVRPCSAIYLTKNHASWIIIHHVYIFYAYLYSCLQPDADTATLPLQGALIIPSGLFFTFPCMRNSQWTDGERGGGGGWCEGRLHMTKPETTSSSSSASSKETGRHFARFPSAVPPLHREEPFRNHAV